MRVSRAQAEKNRERVLNTAARLFREYGFDGIGLADLMKKAGLTHGGFYGQFESKDDLIAQACERALSDKLEDWTQIALESGKDPFGSIAKEMLSENHRKSPGRGCVLSAVGAEVARQGRPVRRVVTRGVEAIVDLFSRILPGKDKRKNRAKALSAYSSMVGAVVLARAVDDPKLAKEILQATLSSLEG